MREKTIAELRKEKGISRMKFAEMMNLHYNTVCRKEQGKVGWTLKEARQASKIFGVPVNAIID